MKLGSVSPIDSDPVNENRQGNNSKTNTAATNQNNYDPAPNQDPFRGKEIDIKDDDLPF